MTARRRALLWSLRLLLIAIALEVATSVALRLDGVRRAIRGDDPYWARIQWVARRRPGKSSFVYAFDAHDPRRGWVLKPASAGS